jgi:hypothetical protein
VQESLHESTDARDRAVGFLVRMLPLMVVWLVLSIAVAIVVYTLADGMWAAVSGLFLWGVLTAGTWLAHDKQEREYAAGGIERHRINKAFELDADRQANDHEARMKIIDIYADRLRTPAIEEQPRRLIGG